MGVGSEWGLRADFTHGLGCYSSSSTCIAFVASLLRLLLFVVLCHLLLWWHKTPPGGFITPKGVVLTRPQQGWLYLPKGAVLSPKRGGFICLKSGHITTQGGSKGGFLPHFGAGFMSGTNSGLDSQSSGVAVSSVDTSSGDTSSTYYPSSSDGHCDMCSKESSDDN